MPLHDYFQSQAHRRERQQLPVLRAVIDRLADERPFDSVRVVFGHLLVRNSPVLAEVLVGGGAELILCDAHPSPAKARVRRDLRCRAIRVLALSRAVTRADVYIDVAAVLARARLPTAAAEVTRTGVHYYRRLACRQVSADNSRAKCIEGFFGTGEGFLRAWQKLGPEGRGHLAGALGEEDLSPIEQDLGLT